MLKDIIAEYFGKNETNLSDKIMNSLMDGYVDVKAYKDTENGKELIYHDTGDNVVTVWMRQAIMMLLSGYAMTKDGNTIETYDQTLSDPTEGIGKHTTPSVVDVYHMRKTSEKKMYNVDGYLLNGEQYIWDSGKKTNQPVEPAYFSGGKKYIYPYFPTKVLFGTGKEYASWDDLRAENQNLHTSWYTKIKEMYGGEAAQANFDTLVKTPCNSYSGTIGVGGNTTGDGALLRTITVNDPDPTGDTTSTTDMATRYGVVGAVKTLYLPIPNNENLAETTYLDSNISDEGRMIKSSKRGAGKPCFIYFNRTAADKEGEILEDWDDPNGAQIFLSKDATNSKFLNRITFRITMPSQGAGSGHLGEYYPYNGYTLKQMGLFNDALFATNKDGTADYNIARENMGHGMLLAIKNIEPFEKKADETLEFTWTLTI